LEEYGGQGGGKPERLQGHWRPRHKMVDIKARSPAPAAKGCEANRATAMKDVGDEDKEDKRHWRR
jgi:hypothetical protein